MRDPGDDASSVFHDARASTTVVISGVVPVAEPGLRGLRQSIDKGLAWPYFRLVAVIVGLIVLMGLTGEQSLQDTFVFSMLTAASAAALLVLPALVRRLGEQPEGRPERRSESLDLVSLAISSEKLLVSRAERSGLEVDVRLRPRLRADLTPILLTGHGLDLANPDHHARIEELIGHDAWNVIRDDRPDLPVWEGLAAMELTTVLKGCLRSFEQMPDQIERARQL